MEASEQDDLHLMANRVCRNKLNAYAAMWSMGHLSFHHGNRLRTALQAHLEHSISFLEVARHHKRRAQGQPASPQQPRKSTKRSAGGFPASTVSCTRAQEAPSTRLGCAAGSPPSCTPCKQVQQPQPVPIGEQLMMAAAAGLTNKLQQLVQQQGADVNQQVGAQGRTALHAAAEAGRASYCHWLLEQLGADSYVYDTMGVSAVMLAAQHGHHEVIKVLLDAGADPFAVDQSGCNALLLAAGCGSAPSVRLLLQEGCVDADYHNSDMGAGGHALLVAAEGGWEECVGLLLSAGAKVNRTDKAGRTALWVASRNGHAAVVQLLLVQPGIKHIRHFITNTTPHEEAQAAGHAALAAVLAAHMALQQTELQQPHSTAAANTSEAEQEHHQMHHQQLEAGEQHQHQQQQEQHQQQRRYGSAYSGGSNLLQQGQEHKQQQHPQPFGQQQQQQHGKAAPGIPADVALVDVLLGSLSPPGHLDGCEAGSELPGLQAVPLALAY